MPRVALKGTAQNLSHVKGRKIWVGRKGGPILEVSRNSAPKVQVKVGGDIVNGHQYNAVPDTGADRTACGPNILNILGIDPLNLCATNMDLRAAECRVVKQLGEFVTVFKCGE